MPFRYLGPPPPDRPNWQRLNKGQQRYALEQYNKALRRRNLPPYVLGGEGVEEDPDLDWNYDGNGDPNVSSGSGEGPSTSGNQHVGTEGAPEYWSGGTDTMATTGGTKRTADSSSSVGGSAAKKQNVSLPGTAGANDGDPDTGNPSPENAVIPRPISNNGGYTMVFRKVHSFISYGCAWKVLKYNGVAGAYLGTTSLMNIPVDQPWFYLSPSEFALLPRGALCTNVRVKGVMRNPRTAFETNSSTSSLATLNQNKFLVTGHGLNLKTRGINRRFTFGNATEPMDVTDTSMDQDEMKTFIKKIYGQDLNGVFECSEGYNLPASYMNLPLMYNSYFCNFTNTNHNSRRMGWERFNEHITKVDASFTVGTTVVDYSYKPKCGLLTLQHDPFFDGLVSVQEPNSGKFSIMGLEGPQIDYQDDIDVNSTLIRRVSDQKMSQFGPQDWKRMFNGERYITNIDLGQYIRQMDENKHSSTVQPSCHVGIYPVHKLTTVTNTIVPTNFTDVECTWDFETEMTISFGCPASRTAYDRLHVEYEKSWLMSWDKFNQNCYNRGDLSIVHGKYVQPDKVAPVSQSVGANTISKERKVVSGAKTIQELRDEEENERDATEAPATPASVSIQPSTARTSEPITVQYRKARANDDVVYEYVHSAKDKLSNHDLYTVHQLPEATTPTQERHRRVQMEDNYQNPHWWPDEKLFQNYNDFLRFCKTLTDYRRSVNIPIIDEPVDFMTTEVHTELYQKKNTRK